MRFTNILTLTLATTAISAPLTKTKRALEDYEAVFTSIGSQVAVVSSTVSSYVSGSVPGSDVQTVSNDLVSVINSGATDVATFDSLSSLDALALVTPIQDLTADVGDLVDAVIAAESNFESDGLSGDVLASLEDQKGAAEALRDAVTPKVPAALQDIAQELAEGIVSEIERGIAAYSD
ncbi:hypothetical protein BDV06DRAFT_223579 [Aspergillus oleicola]